MNDLIIIKTFEPSVDSAVITTTSVPSSPQPSSPIPGKMPSVMQELVQRRVSIKKIAQKIQNRISWAGEELEWLSLESNAPPQTRRKLKPGVEAANEGEKAQRRRTLLDNLFGARKNHNDEDEDGDYPVVAIDIGQLRLGADVVQKVLSFFFLLLLNSAYPSLFNDES
jgi:hypothetical protein